MTESICKHLPDAFAWKDRIVFLDTVDSTNTRAKELALQGAPHGTVVIADRQTGGRGRMGRRFYSPGSAGIYLSVILRPDCEAGQLMHLTCAAAVAMCNAIEAAAGFRPGIKWTNDLVFGSKKLGGILTELSLNADGSVAFAIVGIGINCCQSARDFPADIKDIACSLSMAANTPINRSRVAAAMISALSGMASSLLQKSAVLQRYRSDCITLGQEVALHKADSIRYGTATGIDDNGALIVRFSDGHSEAVASGEVSVRGMYGYL